MNPLKLLLYIILGDPDPQKLLVKLILGIAVGHPSMGYLARLRTRPRNTVFRITVDPK